MKISTVSWALAAIIVVAGLAWYVYANTGSSYVAPASPGSDVTTGPGPGYDGGDMTPTPTTPIATSTSVTASTSLQAQ